MPRMPVGLVSLALVLPVTALAGEVVYQFRTQEDPKAAVAPSVCQGAPFAANVKLLGNISAPEKSAAEGKVKLDGGKLLGTALACVRITDRTFAEGSQGDMYASFELPEGHFAAVGKCMVVSNAVPRQGVVLAGCSLKLTEFPKGFVGGIATSSSVFNPLGLPGYSTGSLWTVSVFEPESAPSVPARPAKAPAKASGGDKASIQARSPAGPK